MKMQSDTICALATPPGAGAISVLRVSGPQCLEIVDKVVRFRNGSAVLTPGGRVKFGEVLSDGVLIDEVLVSIFRAPHSYTGEDSAEISCHASAFVASSLMELLCAAGCRPAEPGEYTRRAFLNGKMDLAQAEAVADVIASSSAAAHRVAISQMRGEYSSELRRLRDRMLELSTLLELELDFSEEEVEFADRSRLLSLLDESIAHISALVRSFKAGNAIKNGVPVAIVGDVNAGKSTLLNALCGEDRSIVSDMAGTTRDTVEETLTLSGVLYRFVDTAGIRQTTDYVEKKGVERSLRAISKASLVLCVLDATLPCGQLAALARSFESRVSDGQGLMFLLNKCDLADVPSSALATSRPVLKVSAKNGLGLQELREQIVRLSPASVSSEGSLVTNLRHLNALREALLSLDAARDALLGSIPTDLVAEDLRAAIASLSSILGEDITTEHILGEIFSRFCIGK